ncbi:carbohydrate ABC transporter permease [Paenibacillus oryzisoli]|uniref:ABC transporter permease n=1 Tax=Paenibacillus oryzisoli TaxID=1850517 RepID=A0A197ZVN7_9BACL|nr:sugar ABC transporter permease [Paenibacillus oryzisoli]OAS13274.1 ABC transporter permease [Paenibacillus oryzisoli]
MNKKIYPSYFAIGAVGLYVVFIIIPSFMGFYYSFTDWSGFSDEITFIGLDNFKMIFSSDEHYMHYINNTLIFSVATIILKSVLGFSFALLLNEGANKLRNIHRVLIFMPAIIPVLVVGLIFKSILNPETGLLNVSLRAVGLDVFAQQWLVDLDWAFKSIIAVDIWKGVGYIMVILLAGLQSISKDYYEAAVIDGANFFAKLKHITIPLLMPALLITTVLNLLYGLRVFDIVYVLTNGGPGYATDVIYTAVFKEFSEGRYGVGTTLSTVLFTVMMIIGYFVIRLMSKEEGVRT